MNRRDCLRGAVGVIGAAGLLGSGLSSAQAFLGTFKGPLHITNTLPSGSGPDVVMRLVAEQLQTKWSRSVVVEPKPGGAGAVAINAVKNAAPNGSNLVLVDVGNLAINPLIFRSLSYDPDADLVPVAILYKTAFFLAVSSNSPYRTLKDLLAAAKDPARPLRFGSNSVGGPIHLSSAQLEHAIGSPMLHVPYKETSQLYAAVATGELDWAFGSAITTQPLVQAGKLRLLAVADRQRFSGMPDVPTLAEAGGPAGVYAHSWVALMAPRGTPTKVAEEINVGVNEALAKPTVRERLASFGFVGSDGPPQLITDWTRADRARYAEVLKRVPVQAD